MSQGPWGRNPPKNILSNGQTGGSMSRARSRMEPVGSSSQSDILSGLTTTRTELSGTRMQAPRFDPFQGTPHTPMPPTGLPRPNNLSVMKSTGSVSTSTPQWPLSENSGPLNQTQTSRVGKSSERSPPQRPPRPSYVPAILDSSRLQGRTAAAQRPGFQQQGLDRPQPRYWEESFTSLPSHESFPVGLSDSSDTSRRTSASSTYSSPALEYPTINFLQPRKSPNLGPPPSSRRGASSHYSQSSYVAPIPEETPEIAMKSHGSFASSHVMPKSWDEAPTEYKTAHDDGEEEGSSTGEGEDGSDVGILKSGEPPGMVRQASLGKRHKSFLRTIQSSGVLGQGRSYAGSASTEDKTSAGPKGDVNRGTDFPSLSPGPSPGKPKVTKVGMADDVPPVPRLIDPRVQRILDGLEKGGTLEPREVDTPNTASTPSVTDEKGLSRPPPLVIDGAKDVETRSSLTSLPELIKRATRLASNLDRGKTASRLGMLDIFGSSDNEKGRLPNRRNSGSIQELLASFPSPGLSTPPGERAGSRWPGIYTNSNLNTARNVSPPNSLNKSPRRKCCGMSIWVFILLCIVLLAVIVVAVVVPVTLVVLPRQHQSGPPSLTACQRSTPCSNSGSSIVVANNCHCICVNGFSGPICAVADNSCTTTNIASYDNASVGNSIPRLLSAANSIYSVPLDSSTLLTNFSSSNLSCGSENALVNFNSMSQRRSYPVQLNLLDDQPSPSPNLPIKFIEVLSFKVLIPRASAVQSPDAITSNGIVLAAPTAANPSPSAATTTTTASSASASTAPSPSPVVNTVGQQILDFARVAVLYILQASTLDTAVTAQGKLQQALGASTYNASVMSAGNNITIDLGTFQIRLEDGTVVGGKVGNPS